MIEDSNGVVELSIDDISQEMGSLIRYLYDTVPCDVYVQEVPEGFKFPALYLRQPHEIDYEFSLGMYKVNYLIPIKVFGENNVKSYNHAKLLANKIRKGRYRIPIYDTDGNATGEFFKLNDKIEVNQVDYGVNEFVVNWTSYYEYEKDINTNSSMKMGKLILTTTVKE